MVEQRKSIKTQPNKKISAPKSKKTTKKSTKKSNNTKNENLTEDIKIYDEQTNEDKKKKRTLKHPPVKRKLKKNLISLKKEVKKPTKKEKKLKKLPIKTKVIKNKSKSLKKESKNKTKEFSATNSSSTNNSILDLPDLNSSIFRAPNPLELKRYKKLKDDYSSIYKIHSGLEEQETILFNELKTTRIIESFNVKLKLMNYQIDGINWMVSRERSQFKGGILADEMGMGKTIQMLSLITLDSIGSISLVVVPAVAISHWEEEILKTDIFLVQFYGQKRELLFNFEKNNILLTTYGTIESYFRKKSKINENVKLPFFKRIILDEAHLIKDSRSSTFSAISQLKSEFRWAMTGTPVQNRVYDLFSLIKYLRIDPCSFYFCKKCDCKSLFWLNYNLKKNGKIEPTSDFLGKLVVGDSEKIFSRKFCTCGHFSATHFSWWNRRIINPIKEFGFTTLNNEIFSSLKKITSHLVLRRTKKELSLPFKEIQVVFLEMCDQEKDFYESIYKNTKRKFESFAIKGEVNYNYIHIFELLQRMRMCVNHPFLIRKSKIMVCGFCFEEPNEPVITRCSHVFCKNEVEFFNGECPICKTKLTLDFTDEVKEQMISKMTLKFNPQEWHSSTKIEKLIELIYKQNTNFNHKSIVFSQYTSFLEIVRWRLERAGFRTVSLYGNTPLQQRKAAINRFNTDTNIFLVSLKAGGLSLNLTESTSVFIMDLWWNPAVEHQAMDRIHRIGQNRTINVYKFVMLNTVEEKVYQLQKKKEALASTAIDFDEKAFNRLDENDLMFLFS